MATTRLRRTFRYPTDSDSDDPADLDEEHQETLLKDLQSQDEATSTLYRHLFLALPVLTSLAYVPGLFSASNATTTFLALLEIAAPALAAYVLYFYPIKVPGKHGLSSLYVASGRSEAPGGVKPRERHVVVFGGVLAGMLVLQFGVSWWSADGNEDLWVGLPGGEFDPLFCILLLKIDVWVTRANAVLTVVYFLTLFVRQQLAPVDLEELRQARYELKGA